MTSNTMNTIKKFDLRLNPKIKEINMALKKDGVVTIENFLNHNLCDSISSILNGDQEIVMN